MLESVFSVHHRTLVNGKKIWVTGLKFFQGDISEADTATDWRFKNVPGERDEAIFLGLVDTTFPIQYPLILQNGLIINQTDYYRYDGKLINNQN